MCLVVRVSLPLLLTHKYWLVSSYRNHCFLLDIYRIKLLYTKES